MINKSFLALLIILPVLQAGFVTVGDNEPWIEQTFNNEIKIKGVVKDQFIKVQLSQQLEATGSMQPMQVTIRPVNTVQGQSPSVPITCQYVASSTSCSVQFDSTYTTVSGDYWVKIDNPLTGFQFVRTVKLVVTGDSQKRTEPLIKVTVAPNLSRQHRIYLSETTNIRFTARYADYQQKMIVSGGSFASLVPETPNTNQTIFQLDQSNMIMATPNVDSDNQIVNINFDNLPAGYYWIFIITTDMGQTKQWQYRFSYVTERYPCPFNPEFPDVSGLFKGCFFPISSSAPPCILYDNSTGVCKECATGYKVTDGRCLQEECPAGQYKRYGECLTNPLGCSVFSQFSKCTQCADTYKLNDGVCGKVQLICPSRTYYNSTSYLCSPVNDKCKQYSSVNGQCTSCKSQTEGVQNGECVSKIDQCGLRQYIADGVCIDVDPLCQIFQKIAGSCNSCVFGYYLNADRKCIQIQCPEKYVPNNYGQCIQVSGLCDKYDSRGVCLQCVPSHQLSANGVCLQSLRPTTCPARQYLGVDNTCHQMTESCDVFNQADGYCTKCVDGFYLMYTGNCVKQTVCKSRQFLINNDCHDVSPTCGNYNRQTGKCLNCISESYQLYFGLCVPVTSCGGRQWTDNNGKCLDVNPKCNTFNPSSGSCTSCVQGYNYFDGICCEKGQYNINGQCVAAQTASSFSSSDGCKIKIDGIGCVRCQTGYQIREDQSGFTSCLKK